MLRVLKKTAGDPVLVPSDGCVTNDGVRAEAGQAAISRINVANVIRLMI